MIGKKFPLRGEVYWVKFDPTVGVETNKTRPGLVVSNDIGNEMSHIVIVAPITKNIERINSYEVKVEIAGKCGKVMLNQCRAVDQSRLRKKLGDLDFHVMEHVDEAIKVAFGLS
jgi:mRNA interferase MazF